MGYTPVMTRRDIQAALQGRLEREVGTSVKEAPLRVALCYPSPYHVGMSSLGFQALSLIHI